MSEDIEEILLNTGNLLAFGSIWRDWIVMDGVLFTKLKHRVPMLFVEDCISDSAEARCEQFVVDAMELGRDPTRVKREDLPNCGMMVMGLTEIHSTARSLLPLR
jgi:hypothetical protein